MHWVDIECDPTKVKANLQKHKLSFAHAEQALRDPFAYMIEDPDAQGEVRFVTLGADSVGYWWLSTRRAGKVPA